MRSALLPEWWDDTCSADISLLPDLEVRVARFLGASISDVRNPNVALVAPQYEGAQLRRVRDLKRDRLAAAIHSAIRIAGAVVRSLRAPSTPLPPPASGNAWRSSLQRPATAVTLDDILGDLWVRGIPVVPVEYLPTPNFQGLACIVEGHPVILLGHKNDEPGRVAFLVAHEAGHIANGDCTEEAPVVDEEDAIGDDTEMETRADVYARETIVGSAQFPVIQGQSFKDLAQSATALERSHGVDASHAIFAWAQSTRDYAKATLAVKALYRHIGARRKLRVHFDFHVDVEGASESDRALLRCIFGDQERDEATD